MMVSTKGRYGLRVMMELTIRYGQGPVLAETIAREQAISAKYIHNICSVLKNNGLIRVSRGRSGGYELGREPETITALEVVCVLEGSVDPLECLKVAERCPRSSHCAARELWAEVADAVKKVLGGKTIRQLADRQKALIDEDLMFFI
jgi:Rrf2 family protein